MRRTGNSMKRLISLVIIGIVFVCSFGVDLGGHSAKAVPVADDCDWPMFGRTPEGNRVAPDGCGPKTDNLELKWKYWTGNLTGLFLAISNGKVYFGSHDKKLYCLDSDSGNINWEYETGDGIYSSPAISKGKVYFGSNDNKFYCLNTENGKKIWDYKTNNKIFSSPVIMNGNVYVGSMSGTQYCLNAENGEKIWECELRDFIYSSPAISNGKLYLGSLGKKFYCLNVENGEKIWEYEAGGQISSSAAISNGKVFFGSNDNKFYCLNAENGQIIWKFKAGGRISSSPAISNAKVYFGSYDKKLYCLNAENGQEVWEYKTDDCIDSSPAISNGKVYFGSWDFNFYCISANNGQIIWEYQTDNRIEYSAAISNSKVFVCTIYGSLYCFGDKLNDSKTTSVSTNGHSIQEIVDTYKSKYTPSYKDDVFEIKPDTSNPYKIGKLKKEYLLEGLNELNFLRYLAGVPETKLDEAACEEAQYGALLLSIIKEMTHFPKCPEYVPKDICEKGYKACSSSNIYGGGSSHIREYVDGWIDDSTNVMGTDPGHRRWALFPYLTQTGFGQADYTLMKAFGFNSSFEQDMSSYFGLVCWPAPGSFPKQNFNPYMTWSVSIDFDVVKLGWASKNDLSVTLTRKSDNKKWIFNKSTPSEGKSYFYLSSIGYGTPYCMNFRPNPDELETINDNESFSVNISGFKDNFNNNVDLSYEINLFDFDKALVSDIKYECTNSIKYMQFQIDSSNWNICGSQQPMMSTAPKIINGRTFLVVKYIAESIGANIRWSEKEKKVSIYSPQRNITIHLWIGRNTAELNGKLVPIDSDNNKVVPLILNGRTILPLRFISESLGLNVEWEAATRRATIFFKPLIGNE